MNEKTLKKAQDLKTKINNLKRRISEIKKNEKGNKYDYLRIIKDKRNGTVEFLFTDYIVSIKKIMVAIKKVLKDELVKKQKQLEKLWEKR